MPEEIKKEEIEEVLGDSLDIGLASPNFRIVMDIPLKVTVELGRTKMLLADLLRLREGSVIELPTAAGEPLDILVNGKPIAKGEVVVVNDRYGVRVISIISQEERLGKLESREW